MNRWNNPLALGSAVQYLLVANLAVFLLQVWFQLQGGFESTGGSLFSLFDIRPDWFERLFGLTPACLAYGGGDQLVTYAQETARGLQQIPINLREVCVSPYSLWQPVSYMFLHGGLWHIGFNMLALWMFGSLLERIWGMRRFLFYYFFCGIGAGVLVALIAFIAAAGGAPDNDLLPVTIGASGSVLGLLTAYGMLFPNNIIYMYFFPVKAKFAVWIFGGLSLLFAVSGTVGGISHWGHLGGILFGLIAMNGRVWLARLRGR